MRARVLTIACVCTALALPAQAHAARQVSYPVLLQQVRSGPLIRAIINPKRGDIEIKFANLDEWESFYPLRDQPLLQRLLHERHVRVIFASSHRARLKRKAVHHHLRYIAAGVLGALAIAALAWALIRRRRTAAPAGGTSA